MTENGDLPWEPKTEPKTFIFRGYNPYIGGVKPSNFMVLGSHGRYFTVLYLFFFQLALIQGCTCDVIYFPV